MNADRITEEQLDEIKCVVRAIVAEAAPLILRAVAASRPGVQMAGELMVTEPARDYPKELWIDVYARCRSVSNSHNMATEAADQAVKEFEGKFA